MYLLISQNTEQLRIDPLHVFHQVFKPLMIFTDKFAVQETRTFFEKVVVRFQIEETFISASSLGFNVILNNKCHIAEPERQIPSENEPIMVLTIEPMTIVGAEFFERSFVLKICDWLVVVGHAC